MVGEERPVLDPPPLARPRSRWRLELEAADEDLVDPLDRRREVGNRVARRVEVAAQDAAPRPTHERRRPLDLADRPFGVVRRVEVREHDALLAEACLQGLAVALLRPVPEEPVPLPHVRIEKQEPLSAELEARRNEEDVRLPGEERPEARGVELRREPRERREEERRHRDHPTHRHRAPALEAVESPDGDLLQGDDVRPVLGHESDHSLEVRPPAGRMGAAVVDVPRSDEEAQGAARRGRSFGASSVRGRLRLRFAKPS